MISSRGCGDSVPVPSNSVTICRVIRKVNCHGRVVICSYFSPQCKSSLCIIHTRVPKTDRIHFGEIRKTFKHAFCGQINSLLCIEWFEHFCKDQELRLITISTSEVASLNKIVSVYDISKPLIHAYNEHDPQKLWILNAPYNSIKSC